MRVLLIEHTVSWLAHSPYLDELEHEKIEIVARAPAEAAQPCECDAVVLLGLSPKVRAGIAILRAIKAAHPGKPVVVISSHGMPEVREMTLKSGAAHFLSNPVPAREFIAVLRAVIKVKAKTAP